MAMLNNQMLYGLMMFDVLFLSDIAGFCLVNPKNDIEWQAVFGYQLKWLLETHLKRGCAG